MMKWAEISANPSEKRYTHLSEFLKKKGVENEVEFIESLPGDFENHLKKACNKFDVLRIGSPFLNVLPGCFDQLPLQVRTLGAGDSLIKSNEDWWIRATLYRAIIKLAKRLDKIDLLQPVLIVGSGGSARLIIGALIRIGFNRFNITDQFTERGQEIVNDLQKRFFNIEFKFTPHSGLTMLPGIHSCMVNTTPLVPSNEILGDLYYFNFLKAGGVVIDLNLSPVETPLLKEASGVGALTISGVEMAALSDMEFVSLIAPKAVDLEEYKSGLIQVFS